MDKEQISIQPPKTTSSTSEEGKITVVPQDGTFTVHHATDHNEISIMKSDWDEICRKANAINLKTKFDWSNLLWGVAIPYCFEAIKNYRSKQPTDFFPLALCFLLLAVFKSVKIPNPFKHKIKISVEPDPHLLDTGNEFANQIHHDDLLNTLDRITKNLTSTDSTEEK